MILVTYDVNMETASGAKRLRNIAKACENVGQRVQKSVFECLVDPEQYVKLKNKLLSIIDKDRDSIRFYILGAKWDTKIEHYGVRSNYNQNEAIIL